MSAQTVWKVVWFNSTLGDMESATASMWDGLIYALGQRKKHLAMFVFTDALSAHAFALSSGPARPSGRVVLRCVAHSPLYELRDGHVLFGRYTDREWKRWYAWTTHAEGAQAPALTADIRRTMGRLALATRLCDDLTPLEIVQL